MINKNSLSNFEKITELSEYKNDLNKNSINKNNINFDENDSNFSFNADHNDKNKVEVNVD